MFFRRANRDKPATPEPSAPVNFEIEQPKVATEPATELATEPVTVPAREPEAEVATEEPASPVLQPAETTTQAVGLAAAELRRQVDTATLAFKTTADLEPAPGLFGQDRALSAIALGVGVRANDFNILVSGSAAAESRAAIKAHLVQLTSATKAPDDWVYVHNFDRPEQPQALSLPRGRGAPFSKAMAALIDELENALPRLFEGNDYMARRRAIDEEFRGANDDALEALNRRAAQQNIAILRTPMGFAMAPMHEGKVVKPEVFAGLPDMLRRDVEAKITDLQKELEQLVSLQPRFEKQGRQKLAELNQEFARLVLRTALEDVEAAHSDLPAVLEFLAAAEAGIVDEFAQFAVRRHDASMAAGPIEPRRNPNFRRYLVKVLVEGAAGDQGLPVIEETNPTTGNLVGRIEHFADAAGLPPEVRHIKPGALHRANGGALLLDARQLMAAPGAWDALKRALTSGQIRIDKTASAVGQTLDPEPIPLDIKVVLFGERSHLNELLALDPDFKRLFKVHADLEDSIARSAETELNYARLIASIAVSHGLKPVDRDGTARLIEEGARLAADREKLSLAIGYLADIMREADHWAGDAGRNLITRADVVRALTERANRSVAGFGEKAGDLNSSAEASGEKVGQVTGLSVIARGGVAIGYPNCITGQVRIGSGVAAEIRRSGAASGAEPLHGETILWGILSGRYALDHPLVLAASLVTDPPESGIAAHGVPAAEVYAALSALSGVPVKPGIAVTGTVVQSGDVRPVDFINERIECFFGICKARGLDGTQGVLIPQSNVQHLMLREDVVEAVEAGQFAVYAIATVDEGLAVLTGRFAGSRGSDGLFPKGSINRLVEDRLIKFAERSGSKVSS